MLVNPSTGISNPLLSKAKFDFIIFAKRRKKFIEELRDNSVVIIPNKSFSLRTHDTEYKFKPDSDFYYLTGFKEPDSICVLKKEKSGFRFILFVKPRNKEKEIWVGKSSGIQGAKSIFKADEAYPLFEFDKKLTDFISNSNFVYIPFGENEDLDLKVIKIIGGLKNDNRRIKKTPQALLDPRDITHKMRLIKDPFELALMQEAADITKEAHIKAISSVEPGMFEYELEAMIEHEFRKAGGDSPAYSTIVGSGKNATTLHYIDNDRKIKKNDLVLIDAGCEIGGYAADVTRTFPARHKFSTPQKEIYEIVLEAQTKAIDKVKSGKIYTDFHNKAVSVIVDGLKELSLLKGSKDEIIEKERYKKFYMHGTGHWLGLEVHDSGPYYDNKGKSIKLEPGMVLTVEPGIYIPANLDHVPKCYRGIGIRIEDDVLVTKDGNKVLTSGIPKTVNEIEEIS